MSKSVAAAATSVRAKALSNSKVLGKKDKHNQPADEAQPAHDAAPAHLAPAHETAVLTATEGSLEGDFSFAQVLADAASSEATFYADAGGASLAGMSSFLQDDGSDGGSDGGAGSTILLVGAVGLVGLGVAVAAGGGGGGDDNALPVFAAATKALAATEDTATAAFAPGATDADGDTITYTISTQGTKGSAAVVNGQVVYTPNANANGTDSFVITANDGHGGTATQKVDVTIAPVNDAATVAATQAITTDENTAKAFTVAGTDVDGDTLTYAVAAQAAHGTVTGDGKGGFTYTPTANYDGADTFQISVTDGKQATPAIQTVSVTVNNVGASTATIAVNAAGTNTDADNVDTTYNVAMGNYTYTITGFDIGDSLLAGTGDRIVGPAGVNPSFDNPNGTDGQVKISYEANGQIANIIITGLTAAQDTAIGGPNSFNTIFGAGAIA